MSVITVKVIRVPGAVSEVGLNSGATVADALTAANESVRSGEVAQLNGTKADSSTKLSDGDRLIVAKGAKGNS